MNKFSEKICLEEVQKMKNEIREFYGIISLCSLVAAALLTALWGITGSLVFAPFVMALGVVFIATLQVYTAPYKAGRIIDFKKDAKVNKAA